MGEVNKNVTLVKDKYSEGDTLKLDLPGHGVVDVTVERASAYSIDVRTPKGVLTISTIDRRIVQAGGVNG